MKKNILFALAVLALAGVLWLAMGKGRTGPRARVEIAGGGTQYVPLEKDGVYHIDGAALPVTLEVRDGKIRFIDSRCPDHVCEGFGWVATEYDTCLLYTSSPGRWNRCCPMGRSWKK